MSINFDGKVTLYCPSIVNYKCSMEIDEFPFDTQNCTFTFVPWTFQSEEVSLTVQEQIPGDKLSTYTQVIHVF